MSAPRVLWGAGSRVSLAAAALATVLLLASDAPEPAQAAPCPTPTYGLSAGEFSVEGGFACSDLSQAFRVYCSGGQLHFDYTVTGNLQGTTNTGYACSAPTHLTVIGGVGGDELDLTAVSAAAGFTGISQPNSLQGGAGNDLERGSAFADNAQGGPGSDTLLLRDGVADSGDCGDGFDSAQADRAGVDTLVGCELADVAPAPTTRKCKKKKVKKGAVAAKKCRKKKR